MHVSYLSKNNFPELYYETVNALFNYDHITKQNSEYLRQLFNISR